MKKLIALLLALMLMATMFAGCSKSNGDVADNIPSNTSATESTETTDGTTIRVLTHMDASFNGVKEAFKEATGINLEVDVCSFDELNDQYEVLLSSKSSEYDVICPAGPNVAAYVSRGYIEPLSDYFTADEISTFSDALIAQGTVDGTFYAAPLGDSCTILYYNKDLFKEADVEWDFDQYDGVNSRITWEKAIELATEVTSKIDPDGSKGVTPIEFGQASQVYMMNILPDSLGGKNISDDGLSVDGILNSEPWTEALTWYQDNVNAGVFSRGISGMDGYNNFYAGKSVFILMTTDSYNYAMYGGMTPENLGFTYQPCFEGHEDQVATACGNWTCAVNANSKNKAAAAEFVKWITYGEGNEQFLAIESMVPNMASRYTDELIEKVPTLALARAESGVTSVVRAVTPGFNEYSNAVSAMWEDIRNGANIESTVASTISDLDSALSYYK